MTSHMDAIKLHSNATIDVTRRENKNKQKTFMFTKSHLISTIQP
jgi:hypothetical protein